MPKESSIAYRTVSDVSGPLLVVENTHDVSYNEVVKIRSPSGGDLLTGTVLETGRGRAVIQVFEGTSGLDADITSVRFTGETMKLPVSTEILGRVLDGAGNPLDKGPPLTAEDHWDIYGSPINPYARQYPRQPIQTGLSSIDGLNTLVRGQKLPIFSGSGLPHNAIAAQIVRQAKIPGEESAFAIVFGAMGITATEAQYFMDSFEETGALEHTCLFLNLANDPAIERIITPRAALTAAEYLAYAADMHVLVILTDMTNYAEALREISAARSEIPGRRGYPGYLYTDLSLIYERAGRIDGRKGTITQMPILSMPQDDMTHPIPDLTGYITEGQIIVGRSLHRRGIYPPIDPGPSLSRLMKEGIGKGMTRFDHKEVQAQLYYGYSEGRDLRDLVAVVGSEALTDRDQKYLKFADRFESEFINQGEFEDRSFEQTLDIGWKLLSDFPERELKRIDPETITWAKEQSLYRPS
ncbi:MAG: V-type ATP synthase subunit B [Candidatus Thorarchaeota archaeon]|nr:MAG: V-type ATP synthase subunit B [Candidatus Thorarchaeota archaeon]